MKDFNFFAVYSKKTQRSKKRKVVIAFIAAFVILIGVGMYMVNYLFELRLLGIRYEIEANQLYMSSPELIIELDRHGNLLDQLTDLKTYNVKTTQLSKQIVLSGLIKTSLLQSITESIPKDTYIESLAVVSDTLTISGIGASEISIADFERNMADLSYVEEVFISSISKQAQDSYSFNMSVRVKEVVHNDEDK